MNKLIDNCETDKEYWFKSWNHANKKVIDLKNNWNELKNKLIDLFNRSQDVCYLNVLEIMQEIERI